MLMSMEDDDRNQTSKAEWRRRIEANRDHDKEQIEDFFNSETGTFIVLGVLVCIVLWFLANTFLYGL